MLRSNRVLYNATTAPHTPIMSLLYQIPPYLLQDEYVQVAPSGNLCVTKSSTLQPRRCQRNLGANTPRTKCEAFCETFLECMAYSHSIPPGDCHLYTRMMYTCPSGFYIVKGDEILSIHEFSGHRVNNWSGCYVKGKKTKEI